MKLYLLKQATTTNHRKPPANDLKPPETAANLQQTTTNDHKPPANNHKPPQTTSKRLQTTTNDLESPANDYKLPTNKHKQATPTYQTKHLTFYFIFPHPVIIRKPQF